jgi:asparagine N-glycosylation enzyme membrane subunit Stt3
MTQTSVPSETHTRPFSRGAGADRVLAAFLVAFCLAVGLAVRFWPLVQGDQWWAKHTVDDELIPGSQDSHYFARYAAQHASGTYGEPATDRLRNYPDGLPHPQPIPLISLVASSLSQGAGLSLNTVVVFLPPILAVLLVLPLWAYRRYLPSRFVVLGGALLGVSSCGPE